VVTGEGLLGGVRRRAKRKSRQRSMKSRREKTWKESPATMMCVYRPATPSSYWL
jgi:hypothetical protein